MTLIIKKILACLLCAFWLVMIFNPRMWFWNDESSLFYIILTDACIFFLLISFVADLIKRKGDVVVTVTLVLVLLSHVLLPPISGIAFYWVAIVPIVIFGIVVVGSFLAKRRGHKELRESDNN